MKFHMWERDYCGNTIKSANVVKFLIGGTRRIFNSVEYSEAIAEFLFQKRKIIGCQLLFIFARANQRVVITISDVITTRKL